MTILSSRLGDIGDRLALPLISAPMFTVSGPELVIAACREGVIGAFPTSNCRSIEELDEWLGQIIAETRDIGAGRRGAPVCPNLIIRQARLQEDLDCLMRHSVEMVITSVGSPAPVIAPLHSIGCKVFADVASLKHVEKAIAAGVDGLVLLAAGAGGQTGWANPFAFTRAVRKIFAGPIVLAGGMADGQALLAAEILGCDLAYMGTRFVATEESRAAAAYKQALLDAGMDDVLTTRAFTGIPCNMLRPSIEAAGLDPDRLDEQVSPEDSREMFGTASAGPRRWADIWSAGHSVSGVQDVPSTRQLVRRLSEEYHMAKADMRIMSMT
ncbi:nitronate monooxygenase [Sphingobium faniae]|nr:nitronate monooxygenase [Sphingobium faniae]